jgi:hypothetical protein
MAKHSTYSPYLQNGNVERVGLNQTRLDDCGGDTAPDDHGEPAFPRAAVYDFASIKQGLDGGVNGSHSLNDRQSEDVIAPQDPPVKIDGPAPPEPYCNYPDYWWNPGGEKIEIEKRRRRVAHLEELTARLREEYGNDPPEYIADVISELDRAAGATGGRS